MTAYLPWDVWDTAQARTVMVSEIPIYSSAHCIMTVLTLSSRRYLAGRSLWPFGQWASDGLGSRQGCQLGRKLAQEGLDEVMGTTLVADGRSRGVRPGQVLPLDRPCGPSVFLQEPLCCGGKVGASAWQEPQSARGPPSSQIPHVSLGRCPARRHLAGCSPRTCHPTLKPDFGGNTW